MKGETNIMKKKLLVLPILLLAGAMTAPVIANSISASTNNAIIVSDVKYADDEPQSVDTLTSMVLREQV